MFTVLSVEPSSTMIISMFWYVWVSALSIHSVMYCSELYTGITTETNTSFMSVVNIIPLDSYRIEVPVRRSE